MADRTPTWAIVADYASRLDAAEKAAAAQHRVWLNLVALLPYAVPVERPVAIPLQRTAPRLEVDLWPPSAVRDAAPSRFIDSRNSPTPDVLPPPGSPRRRQHPSPPRGAP